MIDLLFISGSLRADSSSHVVLRTLAEMMSEDVRVTMSDALAGLPHFDGSDIAPETVLSFRSAVSAADGVIICSPEYAFGVPGTLKNALDWTVTSGEFINKPVALITAATSGEHAHASLLLTLRAISAMVEDQHTLLIPYIRSRVKNGTVTDAATRDNPRILASSFF